MRRAEWRKPSRAHLGSYRRTSGPRRSILGGHAGLPTHRGLISQEEALEKYEAAATYVPAPTPEPPTPRVPERPMSPTHEREIQQQIARARDYDRRREQRLSARPRRDPEAHEKSWARATAKEEALRFERRIPTTEKIVAALVREEKSQRATPAPRSAEEVSSPPTPAPRPTIAAPVVARSKTRDQGTQTPAWVGHRCMATQTPARGPLTTAPAVKRVRFASATRSASPASTSGRRETAPGTSGVPRRGSRPERPATCWYCGSVDHTHRQCTRPRPRPSCPRCGRRVASTAVCGACQAGEAARRDDTPASSRPESAPAKKRRRRR